MQSRVWAYLLCLLLMAEVSAYSQTLCATASVQLSQNATLDRQAFIATMTITDGLPVALTGLNPTVIITDASGTSVGGSLFYIGLNNGSTVSVPCSTTG